MNREVTGNAQLPGEKDVSIDADTARQAGLRTNDIVLTDHRRVADLHKAVDLGAALDACFTHGGAIDPGESLHLDIVLDHGDAGLNDLVVGTIGALGKSESIASDDDAVLQNDS